MYDLHSQVVKQEEPPPYGNCTEVDQEINTQFNFFAKDFAYSRYACYLSMLSTQWKYIYGKCTTLSPCNPLNVSTPFGVPWPWNRSSSYPTRKEKVKRFRELTDKLTLKCPKPCRKVFYQVQKSSVPRKSESKASRWVIFFLLDLSVIFCVCPFFASLIIMLVLHSFCVNIHDIPNDI